MARPGGGERVVASGSFSRVEVRGEGTPKLYRLANGRYILRFEGFQSQPAAMAYAAGLSA